MSRYDYEKTFGLVLTLHELRILTESVQRKLQSTVRNDRPPAVKEVPMLGGRLLVEVEETDEKDQDGDVDLYGLKGKLVSASRRLFELYPATIIDVALFLDEFRSLKHHLEKHATETESSERLVSLLQKIDDRIFEIKQEPVYPWRQDGYPRYTDYPFHVYGSDEDDILLSVKQFASEAEAEAWMAPLALERPGHYTVIHEREFDEGA